jgi:large subunit ribosomal protein L6
MSRLGQKLIPIPAKVEITKDGDKLKVKGPLGELSRDFKMRVINFDITPEGVDVKPVKQTLESKALWGTYASHLKNMIKGVTEGFEKKMSVEGVGFKWAVAGDKVVLNVGFSHDVNMPIPAGIKVVTEKGNMSVSGIDKEAVGAFAAKIRDTKRVEPYKGKGIRYEGEFVRRKQGKKTAA